MNRRSGSLFRRVVASVCCLGGGAAGRQLRAGKYNGPAENGGACCVAVSPGGRRVFVTGWIENTTGSGYTTVAYRR
jgi:hypothetical protein